MSSLSPIEWVPGSFPIPFFQTWCCERSVGIPRGYRPPTAGSCSAFAERCDLVRRKPNDASEASQQSVATSFYIPVGGVPPPNGRGSERAQASSERAQASSERAQASEGGGGGSGELASEEGSVHAVGATPWDDLKNAGLPPKMYECVVSNLIHNRVGVDCAYYLYNDADCRAFIRSAFPPAVVAAYDRLIPTAFKADLWRYCVLYKFGGVYLDVKYRWGVPPRDGGTRGVPPPNGGNCDALLASFGKSRTEFVRCVAPGVSPPNGGCGGGGGGSGGGGCDSVPTLREIVERWGGGNGGGGGGGGGGRNGGGGGGGDDLLCLERDAVDLWAPGHFGIHNAFIITKPKNPLFLECIFRIVTLSRGGGGGGGGGGGDFSAGWMTRPLFVTGPGLLGDVWRDVRWRGVPPPNGGSYARCVAPGVSPPYSGGGGGRAQASDCVVTVPDSYATMAPYFRFFFEGNGIISYFIDPEDNGLDGKYIQILKVYDEYNQEVASGSGSEVPHYTVLWSRGVVWGGTPPSVISH